MDQHPGLPGGRLHHAAVGPIAGEAFERIIQKGDLRSRLLERILLGGVLCVLELRSDVVRPLRGLGGEGVESLLKGRRVALLGCKPGAFEQHRQVVRMLLP